MGSPALVPLSPLRGYARQFDGVSLSELSGLALVSVAVPTGRRDGLARAAQSAYGVGLPDAGSSRNSADRTARLLGLQRDQLFIVFEHDGDDALRRVRNDLGDSGYYTDQSDSWTVLRIAGPGCGGALERMCMLDLDPNAFPVGSASRTIMEHLAVILVRDAPDAFLMLSPRSSADSFLHAIETSISNTG